MTNPNTKPMQISIDHENAAETWWNAARAAKSVPGLLFDLIHGCQATVTSATREEAVAALDWASKLPGWGDGPVYARHPLIASDVACNHLHCDCRVCSRCGNSIPAGEEQPYSYDVGGEIDTDYWCMACVDEIVSAPAPQFSGEFDISEV